MLVVIVLLPFVFLKFYLMHFVIVYVVWQFTTSTVKNMFGTLNIMSQIVVLEYLSVQ